jgi:hypothetical protein
MIFATCGSGSQDVMNRDKTTARLADPRRGREPGATLRN